MYMYLPHMNELCHTCRWVMSHMSEPYPPHESVIFSVSSHVTHMSESCPPYRLLYKWVTLPIGVSHVPHTAHARYTQVWIMAHMYEWVMLSLWMSHVPHMHKWCFRMNESRCPYEWVMSPHDEALIWMSHVLPAQYSVHTYGSCHACIEQSRHACGRVTSCIWMRHVACMN